MLLRALRVLLRTRNLLRSARPPRDPEEAWIRQLFEQLCRDLSIRPRIRFLFCESINVPAVCGALWPMILVPPSMITGVSTDQLRVILAHELAHVRRWDYLINLVQILVESMLFFNPAVWWISRQMRIEREACCDLAVVKVTGRPIAVAMALVAVAAWSKRAIDPPITLPAISRGAGAGSLTDRVQRLMAPTVQPHTILPWYSLAGLLLVSAAAGAALLKGSDEVVAVVVQVTQRILSARERAEKLTDLERQFPPAEDTPSSASYKSAGFSGWVRTEDGSAVPAGTRIEYMLCASSNSTSGHIEESRAPAEKLKFSLEHVDPGSVFVCAQAPGFACAFAGPLRLAPNANAAGIELVLTRGFEGRIRLTNRDGMPLKDARIEAAYAAVCRTKWGRTGGQYFSQVLRSGPEGLIRVPRTLSWPMSFKTVVDGYQRAEIELTLKPSVMADWKLSPAEVATGRVVSLQTSRPVAGADIFLCDSDPRENLKSAQRLGISAADGSYRLTTLESQKEYQAMAHAPGHGWALVDRLRAGEKDRLIRLPSPLVVHGKIIGALGALEHNYCDGSQLVPSIDWRNPVRFSQISYDAMFRAPVRIDKKVGYFELADLLPGRLEIIAGHRHVIRNLAQSIPDLTLDLNASDQSGSTTGARQVIVQFRGAKSDVPLKGTLEVTFANEEGVYSRHEIDVPGSTATFEVPSPNELKFSRLQATGYWMAPKSVSLSNEKTPQQITLDLLPSGAIEGHVIHADGSPCEQPDVHLLVVKKPTTAGNSWTETVARVAEGGQFLFADLPLGGIYAVLVTDDRPGSAAAVLSNDLLLDEAHPLSAITLKLPEGRVSRIRVIDANSRPVANAEVFFDAWFTVTGRRVAGPPLIDRRQIGIGWFTIGPPSPAGSIRIDRLLKTDGDGIVSFRHGQERIENKWLVSVMPKGKWLGRQVVLGEQSEEQTYRLPAGVSTRGIAVDASSGRVIPNLELHVAPAGAQTPGILSQTETFTDLHGEFQFQALEPILYQVSASGDVPASGSKGLVLRGGAKQPLTLRVNLEHGRAGGN